MSLAPARLRPSHTAVVAILAAFLALLVSTACSKGGYPDNFRTQFMSDCRGSASLLQQFGVTRVSDSAISDYCKCAIDKIQGQYTYDQYVQETLAAQRFAAGHCASKVR